MKQIISLALILLLSTVSSQQSLAKNKKPAAKKNPAAARAQLGTSFRFDGTALRGKYQNPLGTAATVENDKLLEDLLKGRTHFADRQKLETERN